VKSEKIDLSDIIKIFESNSSDLINRYLDLGWVLLGTYSDHHSEHGFSPRYSVGWPKTLGGVKVPEKTQHEIEMEEFVKSGDCPF